MELRTPYFEICRFGLNTGRDRTTKSRAGDNYTFRALNVYFDFII